MRRLQLGLHLPSDVGVMWDDGSWEVPRDGVKGPFLQNEP